MIPQGPCTLHTGWSGVAKAVSRGADGPTDPGFDLLTWRVCSASKTSSAAAAPHCEALRSWSSWISCSSRSCDRRAAAHHLS